MDQLIVCKRKLIDKASHTAVEINADSFSGKHIDIFKIRARSPQLSLHDISFSLITSDECKRLVTLEKQHEIGTFKIFGLSKNAAPT